MNQGIGKYRLFNSVKCVRIVVVIWDPQMNWKSKTKILYKSLNKGMPVTGFATQIMYYKVYEYSFKHMNT